MLVTVTEYVNDQVMHMGSQELAEKMGISTSMVSQYKNGNGFKASITVAKRVWLWDKIALHPFSAESLAFETEGMSL